MIFDAFSDLNWLAVVIAAAAYFVLGAIWYSNALFGKQYRAAIGANEDEVMNAPALVTNAVGWFVTALALGLVSSAIGADSLGDGLAIGFVAWFGFIATNRAVANAYEGKGMELGKINGPYNLLGFLIMGVILAVM